jgi:uncharacterized membrane protein YraQ (UPF0718 family)
MPTIILLCLTILALIISFFIDKNKTMAGLKKGLKMFLDLLPPLSIILISLSLLLYFIPKELLVEWLGKESGIAGILTAALAGSISLIPGFVAFPLCNILLSNGATYTVIAVFITTLMMVGVVTLPIEKKFFGLKVALLRNALSLAGAVIIGVLIGLLWGIL